MEAELGGLGSKRAHGRAEKTKSPIYSNCTERERAREGERQSDLLS